LWAACYLHRSAPGQLPPCAWKTRPAQISLRRHDDAATITAKITRAHLNEFPDYHTRRAEMGAEAEADRAAPRRVTETAQEIAALKRAARGAGTKAGPERVSPFWPNGRSR